MMKRTQQDFAVNIINEKTKSEGDCVVCSGGAVALPGCLAAVACLFSFFAVRGVAVGAGSFNSSLANKSTTAKNESKFIHGSSWEHLHYPNPLYPSASVSSSENCDQLAQARLFGT